MSSRVRQSLTCKDPDINHLKPRSTSSTYWRSTFPYFNAIYHLLSIPSLTLSQIPLQVFFAMCNLKHSMHCKQGKRNNKGFAKIPTPTSLYQLLRAQ